MVELVAEEGVQEKGAVSEGRFLKRLQKVLGDHHDVHVIVEMLAGHVGEPRVEGGLATEWRKWEKTMAKGQAKRAGEFFVWSYRWMNR